MASMTGISTPETQAIRAELDRVLASREFHNSARRRALLGFLVEKTLAGEPVKEYVIGVEVFGIASRLRSTDRSGGARRDGSLAGAAWRSTTRPKGSQIRYGSRFPRAGICRFSRLAQKKNPAMRGNRPVGRRPLLFMALTVCAVCALALGYRFLPMGRRAPRAENPAVRELCTKARFFWNKRTPESLRTSLQLYQQAVRMDPLYAPAYAGEALCYAVMGSNSQLHRPRRAEARWKRPRKPSHWTRM